MSWYPRLSARQLLRFCACPCVRCLSPDRQRHTEEAGDIVHVIDAAVELALGAGVVDANLFVVRSQIGFTRVSQESRPTHEDSPVTTSAARVLKFLSWG
jgi:hypothetical protein